MYVYVLLNPHICSTGVIQWPYNYGNTKIYDYPYKYVLNGWCKPVLGGLLNK